MPVQTFTEKIGLTGNDVYQFNQQLVTSVRGIVAIEVTSKSFVPYLNLKYPFFRGFYGYVQLMQGGYVQEAIPLDFDNQVVMQWDYPEVLVDDKLSCLFFNQNLWLNDRTALSPNNGAEVELKLTQKVRIFGFWTTGIRIRLAPGCKANLVLQYRVLQSSECEAEVDKFTRPDPPSADKTPAGNNDSPGAKPGDDSFPFPNDGNDNSRPKPADTPPGEPGASKTWITTVTTGAPAGTTVDFSATGVEGDAFAVQPIPKLQGCAQSRIGGFLNGSMVWESNNCVSPITGYSISIQ